MREKIIGIIIVVLVLTTTLPVGGVMDLKESNVIKEKSFAIKNTNGKAVSLDETCGKAWIICRGNESAMIGAYIYFYNTLLFLRCWKLPSIILRAPLEIIQDSNHPFNGSYGVSLETCGTFKAIYQAPTSTNYQALQSPFFTLQGDKGDSIELYVMIDIQ